MPADLVARSVFTVVFVVGAVVCVRRCVGAPARGRLNDAAHVLMSVEMIAMIWSWSIPDPYGVQALLLGTAAGWFVIQATGVPLTRDAFVAIPAYGPIAGAGGVGHRHASPPRTQCLHHAILLAAMAWMIAPGRVMPPMPIPAGAAFAGPIVGAYCLVVAGFWAVYTRWDIRARLPEAAMTAAMGATLLVLR